MRVKSRIIKVRFSEFINSNANFSRSTKAVLKDSHYINLLNLYSDYHLTQL